MIFLYFYLHYLRLRGYTARFCPNSFRSSLEILQLNQFCLTVSITENVLRSRYMHSHFPLYLLWIFLLHSRVEYDEVTSSHKSRLTLYVDTKRRRNKTAVSSKSNALLIRCTNIWERIRQCDFRGLEITYFSDKILEKFCFIIHEILFLAIVKTKDWKITVFENGCSIVLKTSPVSYKEHKITAQ